MSWGTDKWEGERISGKEGWRTDQIIVCHRLKWEKDREEEKTNIEMETERELEKERGKRDRDKEREKQKN